ncbi:DUF1674 domain-containing protein [Aurantimonas sp. MSK8Z-1]|uniref:DUF1674 domain-containing protein n=1 Tax=Mangrovibrevibacter kandeliae TaxID=2968473 RepID=UPI0021179F5E|nr:DUF1674 domain-containing protein [Aurantimonas sp. MSK8Z-1]MCW4117082.1 DUF1674 domain-containing protein [Aurantimonas sp. MSK8Z-1]
MDESENGGEAAGAPGAGSRGADGRALTPAARRALAEAEERRRRSPGETHPVPEVDGRKGPEPVRYGDWEKNGIISDF